VDDALLEASLVHLRLLDDFLGSKGKYRRDVVATDWLPSWTPKRFLTKTERDHINLQLAHLSTECDWGYPWDMTSMTTACCKTFDDFVKALDANNPGRAAPLAEAREHATRWLEGSPLRPRPPFSTAPAMTLDPDVAFADVWRLNLAKPDDEV
jgi:hypothetical protein